MPTVSLLLEMSPWCMSNSCWGLGGEARLMLLAGSKASKRLVSQQHKPDARAKVPGPPSLARQACVSLSAALRAGDDVAGQARSYAWTSKESGRRSFIVVIGVVILVTLPPALALPDQAG